MRHQAREAVLRCLYRREFFPEAAEDLLEKESLSKDKAFALNLLRGVLANSEALDRLIDRRALGWGIDRLPIVDRNILRLGLYELLHTDTPPEVVINEAVELAKDYGSERAPALVNAILDRVWKEGSQGEKLG